jgi:outer membrane protein assembly factor BamC
MRRFFNAICALGVAFVSASLLGACGIFSDGSDEYRDAKSLPVITLPPGVESGPLDPLFEVPKAQVSEFDRQELVGGKVPRPAPMSQDSEFARVKIQKVGERRWILAEAPTGQVWPLVQSFLARQGISVALAKPQAGVIETGWLSFTVDASSQARYRIRIEKGVRDNASEVHVLHQQLSQGQSAPWPAVSHDAARESWMLDELAQSLAQGMSFRSASLLGQSVGGAEKVLLRRDEQDAVLDMYLDEERAKATLAHALNREGMKIWEESASLGLFYVGYDDPQDEPGWWKKLTFRGNDDLPEQAPATLNQLLARMAPTATTRFGDLPGFAVVAKSELQQGYLLRLQSRQGYWEARISNSRGEPLPFAEAKALMLVIRRNLI